MPYAYRASYSGGRSKGITAIRSFRTAWQQRQALSIQTDTHTHTYIQLYTHTCIHTHICLIVHLNDLLNILNWYSASFLFSNYVTCALESISSGQQFKAWTAVFSSVFLHSLGEEEHQPAPHKLSFLTLCPESSPVCRLLRLLVSFNWGLSRPADARANPAPSTLDIILHANGFQRPLDLIFSTELGA